MAIDVRVFTDMSPLENSVSFGDEKDYGLENINSCCNLLVHIRNVRSQMCKIKIIK